MSNRMLLLTTLAVGVTSAACVAQGGGHSATTSQGRTVDLTKPFQTRSPWRLSVKEGPPGKGVMDEDVPGALTFCLLRGSGPCIADPVTPGIISDNVLMSTPHYLKTVKIVYPHGPDAPPFLLIVSAGLISVDGGQLISTQLVTYDASKDAFHRIFSNRTGHNNNQEIRFVPDGPLRGSVISAEPQEHLPFGYWIVVNQLNPAGEYRQVLRYGSATHYGDGNRLAAIDSEMPNIQKRLGLWKPGDPIPVPSGKTCAKPRLRNGELWCG